MSQTTLKPNQAMALSQLYTNTITEPRLLGALSQVPRHNFVPAHLTDCAYVDEDLNIGEGRYMLAPLDQARLIAAAAIKPGDHVLNIACGTGYAVAVIAKLAKDVTGIDRSAWFKQEAEQQFNALGMENAVVEVVEDLTQGYASHSPYDAIIINGSLEFIPDALAGQLTEGGRLVFIQKMRDAQPGVQGFGRLTVATRSNMRLNIRQLTECFVPELMEFHATQPFRFG